MSRLTITLDDTRYRALKEAAARRGSTIGQLVEAALDFYGIKSSEQAHDLVRRAREASTLDDAAALALAQEEVRAYRAARSGA